MSTQKENYCNEIKSLYTTMVIRYGESFTHDILGRYTDIDVNALQCEVCHGC